MQKLEELTLHISRLLQILKRKERKNSHRLQARKFLKMSFQPWNQKNVRKIAERTP